MGNSLLDIKPHQVSRNLRGYSVLFYGTPKSGKTTIASKFPGALVLAFEKGYLAIPGIMAKPMYSWGDFKKTLRELADPAVKEAFQTVVIDTADIAYGYCEKYICSQASDMNHTYDNIGEIPFGKGYNAAQTEFDECIRKILQMDYGLVLISHSTDKVFKDENDVEYSQIVPTLDKRARQICERTCDIIGFSKATNTEDGVKTKLYLRGTPRYVAGSRFRYTPDSIDFTYDSLVKAIADAIDMEEKSYGPGATTDSIMNVNSEQPDYNFSAMMDEFQSIVGKLMATGNPTMHEKIAGICEAHLGAGKKVAECTPANAAQLDMILFDLKRL